MHGGLGLIAICGPPSQGGRAVTKFVEMVKGEHDEVVWKLSLSSDQLVAEKERANMAEASLAIMSACLDKSIVDYTEPIIYYPRGGVKGRRTLLKSR